MRLKRDLGDDTGIVSGKVAWEAVAEVHAHTAEPGVLGNDRGFDSGNRNLVGDANFADDNDRVCVGGVFEHGLECASGIVDVFDYENFLSGEETGDGDHNVG